MNDLITTAVQESNLTMSSREIADLVETRHSIVKQSIERLITRGVVRDSPLVNVLNSQGQSVAEYRICKRDTYVVVAQLLPEFTGKLVDRWQELETQAASPPAALTDANVAALMQGIAKLVDERIALAITNDPRVAALHCQSAKDVCTRLKIPSKGRGKLVSALSHKLSSWCMGTSQTITHCPRSGVRLFPVSAVDSWLVRGGKEWVHGYQAKAAGHGQAVIAFPQKPKHA